MIGGGRQLLRMAPRNPLRGLGLYKAGPAQAVGLLPGMSRGRHSKCPSLLRMRLPLPLQAAEEHHLRLIPSMTAATAPLAQAVAVAWVGTWVGSAIPKDVWRKCTASI